MLITIDLNPKLIKQAQKLTGVKEAASLIHMGLRALIQQEIRKRLTKLGGIDKFAKTPRRK